MLTSPPTASWFLRFYYIKPSLDTIDHKLTGRLVLPTSCADSNSAKFVARSKPLGDRMQVETSCKLPTVVRGSKRFPRSAGPALNGCGGGCTRWQKPSRSLDAFNLQQELLRARLLNIYPPPPPPPPDITLLKKENAQTVQEYFAALTVEQSQQQVTHTPTALNPNRNPR
jgi:hypothetical protein